MVAAVSGWNSEAAVSENSEVGGIPSNLAEALLAPPFQALLWTEVSRGPAAALAAGAEAAAEVVAAP